MRILLTVWAGEGFDQSPFDDGAVTGAEINVRDYAALWAQWGHDTHVFSLSRKPMEERVGGVNVHHRVPSPEVMVGPPIARLGAVVETIRQQTLSLCREHSIEVLYPRTIFPNGLAGYAAAKDLGIPVFPTADNREFIRLLRAAGEGLHPELSRFRPLLVETLERSDGVIYLATHLRTAALCFVANHGRHDVIPPGMDLSRFDRADPNRFRRLLKVGNRPMLLCVARMEPPKRQDLLIRAMPLIRTIVPDVLLVFAGDGSTFDDNRRLTAELRQEAWVCFLGKVLPPEIPDLYAAATLSVCPTEEEGFPNVLVETLAAGRPILASAVSPYVEVLQNGTAGVTVPNDARAFARATIDLLANPCRLDAMGKSGRRLAATYSLESSARSVLTLFETALASRSVDGGQR